VGSDGTVVVLEAVGTVALGIAPRESLPATSAVIGAGWVAGGGTAALAGAAGVMTCTGCWSGVPEPLAAAGSLVGLTAARPLVGLIHPAGVVVAAMLLRGARGVRLASTTVRVSSTRLRVPVSDAELASTGTEEAKAPSDTVVEATVTASAGLAWTPKANAPAVAIRPRN
jgi:hypothetical protein